MKTSNAVCAYSFSEKHVGAWGIVHPETALAGWVLPIAQILLDVPGRQELREMIDQLGGAPFPSTTIHEVLDTSAVPLDSWRVAEALGQVWLVKNRACEFPVPPLRHRKNPRASEAGSELVGFARIDGKWLPAVGEVKYSEDKRVPPRVVTKEKDGLNAQLIALSRPNHEQITWLCNYLALASRGQAWRGRFQEAWKNYLRDESRPRVVFGMLVRDAGKVKPDERDLQSTAKKLASLSEPTVTELFAHYLPTDSAELLAKHVRSAASELLQQMVQ